MKLKFFLLLAAFVFAGMRMQAQVKILFNPAQGTTYTYRTVSDQKTAMSFGGQEMVTNSVMEMLTEMRVKTKSASETSLDYTIKEIVMSSSNPMMSYKVDTKNKAGSASEVEKLMFNLMECLIGKTLQVVIAPDGAVKTLTGYSAISDCMQKLLAAGGNEAQMANMTIQQFNETAIKNNLEQTFKIYPNKDVKAGDNWSTENSQATNMNTTNTKNTYSLKSLNNDIALIDVVTNITMKPGGGMEGEMKGEQKGEMRLNVKTGMPVQTSGSGTIKGKFSGQGGEVSLEVTTKSSYTLQQ